MESKPFASLIEQMNILKQRGLVFKDEPGAMELLSSFGYYEIINGYKSTFLESCDPDIFKAETTFEDIYSLYFFDTRIRNVILGGLDAAESILRQNFAYVLGEQHSEQFSSYMNNNVFNAGRLLPEWQQKPDRKYYTERDRLFKEMTSITYKNYDPYKHYKTKYGNTPPWILVKGTTFGQLKMAITLLNSEDKKLLISRLYGNELINQLPYQELVTMFHETLELMNKFRNRAAHGGRMYNYFPEANFTYSAYLYNRAEVSKTSVSKKKNHGSNLKFLMAALSMWRNITPSILLSTGITEMLRLYGTKAPAHLPFILDEMELHSSEL
ncbi:Abi family protein [Weissella tructae]|uniref:Abi family protein n=1 Tax=Weissella tructae TaxID=887702 RepID=UPI003D8E0AB0